MSKPPLNYTTKIPVNRTTGQCIDLLAEFAQFVAACRNGEFDDLAVT